MDDNSAEVRALTEAVQELKVTNATNTAVLRTVQETLVRIERVLDQSVSRREFDELKKDVEAQASNWAKIAWFIGLAIASSLLAVILRTQELR